MQTTHEVADVLGRAEMAAQIGVGLTAISAAVSEGFFRSAWYMTIRKMAAEKNFEVSDGLFRWKGVSALEAPVSGGAHEGS